EQRQDPEPSDRLADQSHRHASHYFAIDDILAGGSTAPRRAGAKPISGARIPGEERRDMADAAWVDVGDVEELAAGPPVREVRVGRVRVALVRKDGAWSAISGVCNHVGGPLGQGHLDGDYVVCPWHGW